MPNIGANSLAFMLDLNSKGFTSAFKEAKDAYKSFTDSLNKQNKALNKAGQAFLDSAGMSVKAYSASLSKIQEYASKNPILQPVEFVVSQKSRDSLASAASSIGGGGGGGRRGGVRTPAMRLGKMNLTAVAKARGISLGSEAAQFQSAFSTLIGGGASRSALDAAKAAQQAFSGSLSVNERLALGPEMLRVDREILRIERQLEQVESRRLRSAQQLTKQQEQQARQQAKQAKQAEAQKRGGILQSSTWRGVAAQIARDPGRILAGTYALTNIAHLTSMSANSLSGLSGIPGISGVRGYAHEAAVRGGGTVSQQYADVAASLGLAPGASAGEVQEALLTALRLSGNNRAGVAGTLTNIGRLGVGINQAGGYLMAGRAGGLGLDQSQLLSANLALGAKARGSLVQASAGDLTQIMAEMAQRDSGIMVGKGAGWAQGYLGDTQRVLLGMTEAAGGDTSSAAAFSKLMSAAQRAPDTFGAQLGIRKGASASEVFKQLQSRRGMLQQVLASGNPEVFAQYGLGSTELGALVRGTEGNVNISGVGEAGTLSAANAALATSASQTRDTLDVVHNALAGFASRVNALLGGGLSQAGAVLMGGAQLAGIGANIYTGYRAFRNARADKAGSIVGGAAEAAVPLAMTSRIGKVGMRSFGRSAAKFLPGVLARSGARIAGGSLLGPVGAGAMAAWGIADVGMAAYSAYADSQSDVQMEEVGGKIGAGLEGMRVAMSGVESRLDITNSLLSQILQSMSGSQTLRPSTQVPTTAPVPSTFPSRASK